MTQDYAPQISAFYCINSVADAGGVEDGDRGAYRLKTVKMPCSSIVKRVYLLRAFEAGADGVAVFVCPEEACRYTKGSYRAGKRVAWLKKLLDEIGIGGERLSIHPVSPADPGAVEKILLEKTKLLRELGPNPAGGR